MAYKSKVEWTNANFLSSYFLNTDYRTHKILLNNSMGVIIPRGKHYVKD